MRFMDQYREGLITLDEMVERELSACWFDDNWLKDALRQMLSKDEYSRAWKEIDKLVRERSYDRVFVNSP